MKPYYQDSVCACGCNATVRPGRKFVSGHNLRDLPRTDEHRRKIGEGQRRAWITSRKRHPIGSTNIDVNGYRRVKVLAGSGRWEKEHVLVAEKMMGRALMSDECVHHINGIKSDNRPENLFVCTLQEHSRIEAQAVRLLKSLVSNGSVTFNRDKGEYERVL